AWPLCECLTSGLRSAAPRARHSFPTRRSSDLQATAQCPAKHTPPSPQPESSKQLWQWGVSAVRAGRQEPSRQTVQVGQSSVNLQDRKSTRLNSSHVKSSYAVFCLKTKNTTSSY